jgi:hypothetical protein
LLNVLGVRKIGEGRHELTGLLHDVDVEAGALEEERARSGPWKKLVGVGSAQQFAGFGELLFRHRVPIGFPKVAPLRVWNETPVRMTSFLGLSGPACHSKGTVRS